MFHKTLPCKVLCWLLHKFLQCVSIQYVAVEISSFRSSCANGSRGWGPIYWKIKSEQMMNSIKNPVFDPRILHKGWAGKFSTNQQPSQQLE
jgi:hypothetical protein